MNNDLLVKILSKMDEAKPPQKKAEEVLSDVFLQKHTKFKSFKEMVQLAIKESGMLDEYLENLKEKLKT